MMLEIKNHSVMWLIYMNTMDFIVLFNVVLFISILLGSGDYE